MKKLNVIFVVLVTMILIGCGASRIDQKATTLGVESLAQQVTGLVSSDTTHTQFEQDFQDEDKFLLLTLKDDEEIQIRVKNPDPIKKPIKWGFVKSAKFIGRYENIKFTSTQAETIQRKCRKLFEQRQRKLIKEELKYHEVD